VRIGFVALALALMTAGATPAGAQSTPQQPTSGDGGLHVSNGGSIGYVGGSGSISGTVRGPGGGDRRGSSAPKRAVTPKPDGPSAVTGGVVEPAEAGVLRPQSVENAKDASSLTGPMLAAGMVALACAVLFVRRRPSGARDVRRRSLVSD
jgi:hypothetical protein